MLNFQEKYDDLIKRGYVIELYEENRENNFRGKYKAYCCKISKPNQTPFIQWSPESFESAVIITHECLLIQEKYLGNSQ